MNVADACRRLAAEGLVRWSSGNASERFGKPAMLIKPSGVHCSDMLSVGGPEYSVVYLENGHVCGDSPKPSTDSETHRYIYNHLPEINGIVHTHSNYASAFAWAGIPIPCISTAIADEFGDEIPVSQYCSIGNDEIGKEVVRLHEKTGCHAILIRQHGVFCVGRTVEAAVKSAVMLEDCAKTAWLAMHFFGSSGVKVLPPEEIVRNHKRYHESYGQ